MSRRQRPQRLKPSTDLFNVSDRLKAVPFKAPPNLSLLLLNLSLRKMVDRAIRKSYHYGNLREFSSGQLYTSVATA